MLDENVNGDFEMENNRDLKSPAKGAVVMLQGYGDDQQRLTRVGRCFLKR